MKKLFLALVGVSLAGCAGGTTPPDRRVGEAGYENDNYKYNSAGEWEYRGRKSIHDRNIQDFRNNYNHPNAYRDPRWPNAGRP